MCEKINVAPIIMCGDASVYICSRVPAHTSGDIAAGWDAETGAIYAAIPADRTLRRAAACGSDISVFPLHKRVLRRRATLHNARPTSPHPFVSPVAQHFLALPQSKTTPPKRRNLPARICPIMSARFSRQSDYLYRR